MKAAGSAAYFIRSPRRRRRCWPNGGRAHFATSGSELARAEDVRAVGATAVATLARFEYDLPFVLYYVREDAADSYRLIAHHGVEAGSAAAPLEIADHGDDPWPLARAITGARILQVSDLRESCETRGADHIPSLPMTHSSFRSPRAQPPCSLPALRHDCYSTKPTAHSTSCSELRSRTRSPRCVPAKTTPARRMLAEVDRAKTAFFSNISHEFRTPLTLMLGPLEEILADRLVVHHRPQLSTIHRNGVRLLRLVNALLDFSRVEAGRAEAHYEPTDLCDLTAQLASNFQSACDVGGLRLVVDCPSFCEPVYVDPDMWETIVLNLISNAFKFTAEGSIIVRLQRVGSDAVLTVRRHRSGHSRTRSCANLRALPSRRVDARTHARRFGHRPRACQGTRGIASRPHRSPEHSG